MNFFANAVPPTLESVCSLAEKLELEARAETWTACPCIIDKMLIGLPTEEIESQIKSFARAAAFAHFKNEIGDSARLFLRHLCARARFDQYGGGDLQIMELKNEH